MTAREKKLAMAVGAIVLFLLNYALIKYFIGNERRLREDYATKRAQFAAQQTILQERELWEKRSAWVQTNLPKLTNENLAAGALLEQVQELAKKNGVTLERPAYGSAEKQPQYISIGLQFETKSTWQALCAFLNDLQGQERFVVVGHVTLEVDKTDPTQMHANFQRLEKWFAPR